MNADIVKLETQLSDLKMQMIDSDSAEITEGLMKKIVATQRNLAALKLGKTIEEVKDPAPRISMVAAKSEIQRLRGEIEVLSRQILKTESDEAAAPLKDELMKRQQEIGQIRGSLEAAAKIDEDAAREWWGQIPPKERIQRVISLMEEADEHEDSRGRIIPGNSGKVGLYRSVLDFIRAGRDIPARTLIGIWRDSQ